MTRDDRSGEFTAVLVSAYLHFLTACETVADVLLTPSQGFFIAICTVLVLLRCYCKVFLVRNFATDDYFSVLTLVSSFAQLHG